MSTTYNTAAVIGCKVPRTKIWIRKETRSCRHVVVDDNANFCPECGKKLWKTTDHCISQYDDYEGHFCYYRTIDGYRVFGTKEDDFVIIAAQFIKTDLYSGPQVMQIACPQDIPFIQKSFKKRLQQLDLWDENEFGIWVVMWCT